MLRGLSRAAMASAAFGVAATGVAAAGVGTTGVCESVGVKRQGFDLLFKPTTTQNLAGKTALITGASAGIGKATACAFAAEGVNLVLVARRMDKLLEIKEEVKSRKLPVTVTCIAGDCAGDSVYETLREQQLADKIDICVANAGCALGKDPVATAQVGDWATMMEANCIGAFRTIRAVLPGMIARGGGTVIATGSIAGIESYEGGSVYCASKHALHAFMQALRFETYSKNIRVAVVAPGAVGEGTEFSEVRFKGDKATAAKTYENIQELKATDVASQILHVARAPAHVNIDMVVLKPTCQGSATRISRSVS